MGHARPQQLQNAAPIWENVAAMAWATPPDPSPTSTGEGEPLEQVHWEASVRADHGASYIDIGRSQAEREEGVTRDSRVSYHWQSRSFIRKTVQSRSFCN
jgi:hypothetical protein